MSSALLIEKNTKPAARVIKAAPTFRKSKFLSPQEKKSKAIKQSQRLDAKREARLREIIAEKIKHVSVIGYDGITVEWILVTPMMAADILVNHNPYNRPLRKSNLEKLRKALRGKGFCAESMIMLDKDGNCMNGQHRLEEICETLVAVYMCVGRGFPKEVFNYIDKGSRRSVSDSLVRYTNHLTASRLTNLTEIPAPDSRPSERQKIVSAIRVFTRSAKHLGSGATTDDAELTLMGTVSKTKTCSQSDVINAFAYCTYMANAYGLSQFKLAKAPAVAAFACYYLYNSTKAKSFVRQLCGLEPASRQVLILRNAVSNVVEMRDDPFYWLVMTYLKAHSRDQEIGPSEYLHNACVDDFMGNKNYVKFTK